MLQDGIAIFIRHNSFWKKDCLCLYTSTNNRIRQLTSQECIIVEKRTTLLGPFEKITEQLSVSNISTSPVIPLLITLENVSDESDVTDQCK